MLIGNSFRARGDGVTAGHQPVEGLGCEIAERPDHHWDSPVSGCQWKSVRDE